MTSEASFCRFRMIRNRSSIPEEKRGGKYLCRFKRRRADKPFASNEQLNKFVADNMDNLAKDIAMGHGESLDTLVELIGVAIEERPVFCATLQTNFSEIFPSERVTHVDVLENIARLTQG